MDDNKKTLNSVTKSNQLMSASYYLTADEQRLIIACISKVNPIFDKKVIAGERFYIRAAEFEQMFKLNKNINVYQVLKRVSDKLYNRSFTLKHDGAVVKSRWVSEIGYYKDEGIVHLSFAPLVIEHITQLKKNFTSYKLLNVQDMESIYGIRVYELIIRMGSYKSSLNFRFDDLKNILGIEGKYKKGYDFKRKVLEPAKNDINNHSDLIFDWRDIWSGRKIIGFRFIFKEKPEHEKPKNIFTKVQRETVKLENPNDIEIDNDLDEWFTDDIDF